MKSTFEITTFLAENREAVILSYNNLTKEAHFNGTSLKSFMTDLVQMFKNNRVASEKLAKAKFEMFLDVVYYEQFDKIADFKQDALSKKYTGTAYMAIV